MKPLRPTRLLPAVVLAGVALTLVACQRPAPVAEAPVDPAVAAAITQTSGGLIDRQTGRLGTSRTAYAATPPAAVQAPPTSLAAEDAYPPIATLSSAPTPEY